MPKIFISYRRDDSAYVAHQIRDALGEPFGEENIIFDVESIPLGADFRAYLNDQIEQCDVLLALLGDQWLGTLTERHADPADFVRIEIEAALKRNIPVIPVLVGKATMPNESELPEALVPLAYRNATEVRAGADFRSQLARLVMALEQLLSTIPTPTIEKSKPQPTSGKPATSEKQTITVTPSSTETPGTISKSQKKKSAAPVNYIPLWFSPVAAVSLIFLTYIALSYLSNYRQEPVLVRIQQLERTAISFNPEGGVEGINQNDREKGPLN